MIGLHSTRKRYMLYVLYKVIIALQVNGSAG